MDCPRCGAFCSTLDETCECGFDLASARAEAAAPAPKKKRKKKRRRRRRETVQTSALEEIAATRVTLLVMLVLTWISCGMYVPLWYVRRQPMLDRLGEATTLGSGLPLLAAGCGGVYVFVGVFLRLAGAFGPTSELLAFVVSGTGGVINLVMAFRVRSILNDLARRWGRPADVSGVWTFFFHVYYLQYVLNRAARTWEPADVAHVFE